MVGFAVSSVEYDDTIVVVDFLEGTVELSSIWVVVMIFSLVVVVGRIEVVDGSIVVDGSGTVEVSSKLIVVLSYAGDDETINGVVVAEDIS